MSNTSDTLLLAVDGASRKHAFASASGSKCWMKCTAQPGFVERERVKGNIPWEDEPSESSIEGTLAHDLAAQCLLLGYDESLFEDPDMARHVKGYVSLIEGWNEPDWELFIEQEVPLFYHPEETGFLDAGAVKRDGTAVRIGDLKYGVRFSVQAKRNTQLAIYSLSLIEQLSMFYNFTDNTLVTLLIHQPRVEGEHANRLWVLPLKELREFCRPIGVIARAIYADPASGDFSPDDDTCQWCPAVSMCSARAVQLFGGLPDETHQSLTKVEETLLLPLPESLTVDQLAKVVRVAPDLKDWLSKCQAAGAHRLHQGLPFPGFKVVSGRSIRKWRNKDEVSELLALTELPQDEWFTVKPISPTQAEEKLSKQDWARIKHAVIKPEGAPTMVPEDDQRPAIAVNPTEIFENLEQDTDNLLLLS